MTTELNSGAIVRPLLPGYQRVRCSDDRCRYGADWAVLPENGGETTVIYTCSVGLAAAIEQTLDNAAAKGAMPE